MTDTKDHSAAAGAVSLEGRTFRPTSPQELTEAVELAFDYRGDVTLYTTSGQLITGYIFNRDATGTSPYLEIFPSDESAACRINYNQIASIAFTGQDTASGKSWEAWIAKKESERRAETRRVATDAESRGHL